MRNVEVDDDAYDLVMKDAKYGESFTIMIRKLKAERDEATNMSNDILTVFLHAIVSYKDEKDKLSKESNTSDKNTFGV